ncbi:hypothetical protein [Cypionkella aquatica]|uniref:hypothetical protein n=1 Tax=Cypionkella aquatica TaxID=1756042 RepID=UPI0024E13F4B|nr:hypothetical protein [Cypionkella aquatica]
MRFAVERLSSFGPVIAMVFLESGGVSGFRGRAWMPGFCANLFGKVRPDGFALSSAACRDRVEIWPWDLGIDISNISMLNERV